MTIILIQGFSTASKSELLPLIGNHKVLKPDKIVSPQTCEKVIIFVYNVLTNTRRRSEIDERFQVSQNMNHSDDFLRSSLWDCSEDFMRRGGGYFFLCVRFH